MTMRARRKHDVSIDGYRIRNKADFDRIDLSKPQRRREHRATKLEKRAEASRRAGEARE